MTRQIKPSISVVVADQNLARAIEALKTARVMLKGSNPNWSAAGDFMSAARDMVCDTYRPIIDALVARSFPEDGDV